jgi:hypothetical protein
MTKVNKTKNLLERWPEYRKPRKLGKLRTAYKRSEDDPLLIQPDFDNIPYFEEVFDLLETRACSWREGTAWINNRCVMSISHMTLKAVYNRHRKPFSSVDLRATPAQAKNLKKAQKVSTAKYNFKKAQREYEELKGSKTKAENTPKREAVDYDFTKVPANVDIIFEPNPGPQTDFLASSETQVLYGGAAGGETKVLVFLPPFRVICQNKFRELTGTPSHRGKISSQALV